MSGGTTQVRTPNRKGLIEYRTMESSNSKNEFTVEDLFRKELVGEILMLGWDRSGIEEKDEIKRSFLNTGR